MAQPRAEGALGVQGTTFDVIAHGGESELFVYVGVVSATHVDPAFPDVKLVRAGETVRWKIDDEDSVSEIVQEEHGSEEVFSIGIETVGHKDGADGIVGLHERWILAGRNPAQRGARR